MLNTVAQQAGKSEEYSHRFFLRVKSMVDEGDHDGLLKEKIALKMMRLSAETQRGFILIDHPLSLAQAEQLEEYRGGLNAFVHLSLPAEV